MSAENLQNRSILVKTKLEAVHQELLDTEESIPKNHGFPKFCKATSLKTFEDKDLQTFNDFTKSGKVFIFIF